MNFKKVLMGAAVATVAVSGVSLMPLTSAFAADGIPTITAGDSTVPAMDVVDVASYQGNLSVSAYNTMKKYGVKAVIVKVSEGTNYVNPYASTQIKNAQAAGLAVGVYHYSRFSNTSGAKSEANYFAKQVAALGLPKSTLMVDDLEDSSTSGSGSTTNANAFKSQLSANGYDNQMLYTYPSYINATGLNVSNYGEDRVWIASYPYAPNKNNLWYTNYGAWQWNSATKFPGVNGFFDVSKDYSGKLSSSAMTGYLQDKDGNWYWFENGVKYTGFRFYMGTYYYFKQGVRQENQWVSQWGNTYYVGSDGRAYDGVRTINGKKYFFGNDSTFNLRTNQIVKVDNVDYRAAADGVLTPNSGYHYDGSQYNGGYRWYENGQLYTGFRYYMGTYYWFVDGVRQNEGWRQAWGLTYWTDNQGRAVQGLRTLEGKQYYFGNDGTYNMRKNQVVTTGSEGGVDVKYRAGVDGTLSPYSGYQNDGTGWYWFENGAKFTGFRMYYGAYYYFENGVRQENQWVSQWGHKYYVGADGRTVQGSNVNINGQTYNFGTDGTFYLR